MRATTPLKARSAGRGALVGFLTTCLVLVSLGMAAKKYGGSLLTAAARANHGAPVKTQPGQSVSTPAATFGQIAFTSLCHDEPAAESYLDWESLKTSGTDVGTFYLVMPGNEAKASFRKSFIKSFAKSFGEKGATAESLTNWHTESQTATQATVVAIAPNGRSLVLTLSKRDGFWRISTLDFR